MGHFANRGKYNGNVNDYKMLIYRQFCELRDFAIFAPYRASEAFRRNFSAFYRAKI